MYWSSPDDDRVWDLAAEGQNFQANLTNKPQKPKREQVCLLFAAFCLSHPGNSDICNKCKCMMHYDAAAL